MSDNCYNPSAGTKGAAVPKVPHNVKLPVKLSNLRTDDSSAKFNLTEFDFIFSKSKHG
jgi:hypothetical protein